MNLTDAFYLISPALHDSFLLMDKSRSVWSASCEFRDHTLRKGSPETV